MQCPFCQHTDSRVLESRSAESGQSIRRRRECLACSGRFTTYERIEFVPITVIKRDGQRESFDRSKLLRGIVTACGKTGISATRLESLVDDIEAEFQQRTVRDVTSVEVGEAVLAYLKQLSEVAYVRFASVYRKFQGIRDFVEELHSLQGDQLPVDSVVNSLEVSSAHEAAIASTVCQTEPLKPESSDAVAFNAGPFSVLS